MPISLFVTRQMFSVCAKKAGLHFEQGDELVRTVAACNSLWPYLCVNLKREIS